MFNKGIFQIEWKSHGAYFLPGCWLSLYTFEKYHKHLDPIEIFTQADPNNACGSPPPFLLKIFRVFVVVVVFKGKLFWMYLVVKMEAWSLSTKPVFTALLCRRPMYVYSCTDYCRCRRVITGRTLYRTAKSLCWNGIVFLTWSPRLIPLCIPPAGSVEWPPICSPWLTTYWKYQIKNKFIPFCSSSDTHICAQFRLQHWCLRQSWL